MNEAKRLNFQEDSSVMMNKNNASDKNNLVECPRSVEEVYSLGIKLQYVIGDMYLNASNSLKGQQKATLKALALKQLDRKTEIQKLANIHLNEKLAYFYNNGGPIIEPPVNERQAKEVNGFFNRIVNTYLEKMDVKLRMSTDSLNAHELEDGMDRIRIQMLTDLANLYYIEEIRSAFKAMITL